MAKTRGSLLATDKGQIVGKQQLYALLTDASGNAVLDASGNEQLIEIQADENGKIKTQAEINGSLSKLSTDPFPAGQEGWELLEYYLVDGSTKVYKHISGDWREI